MSKRERSVQATTSKVKKCKVAECMSNEEIIEEENWTKQNSKVRKVILSQPIFKKDLKKKLHFLLSNWKPPLKNVVPDENQEVSNTKTDKVQYSDIKNVKYDNSLSETTTKQNVSPKTLANTEIKTREDNSFNNKDRIVKINFEEQSLNQEQGTQNVNKSLTSFNEQSLVSIIRETHKAFDSNEQMPKDNVLEDEVNAREIKPMDWDSKSKEESAHEQGNIESSKRNSGFSTPEASRTPPTPPTLKILWLNSNTEDDLTVRNFKNISANQESEELFTMHNKLSNDKMYNEAFSIKNEEVNSNELSKNSIKTMNTEIKIMSKLPEVNSSQTKGELEDDLSISYSQLDSIENNISTSISREHLPQELNSARFIPDHPTSLTPKMPRINWVHKIQEDKKRLQAVVREISQLKDVATACAIQNILGRSHKLWNT